MIPAEGRGAVSVHLRVLAPEVCVQNGWCFSWPAELQGTAAEHWPDLLAHTVPQSAGELGCPLSGILQMTMPVQCYYTV